MWKLLSLKKFLSHNEQITSDENKERSIPFYIFFLQSAVFEIKVQ